MILVIDSKDVPDFRVEDAKDKEEGEWETRWEVSEGEGIGIPGSMRCEQWLQINLIRIKTTVPIKCHQQWASMDAKEKKNGGICTFKISTHGMGGGQEGTLLYSFFFISEFDLKYVGTHVLGSVI